MSEPGRQSGRWHDTWRKTGDIVIIIGIFSVSVPLACCVILLGLIPLAVSGLIELTEENASPLVDLTEWSTLVVLSCMGGGAAIAGIGRLAAWTSGRIGNPQGRSGRAGTESAGRT